MNRKTDEVTAEYVAISKSGRRYRIVEITTFIEPGVISGPQRKPARGSKRFQLENGDPVNRISDSEFEIVLTDERAVIER